MGWTEYILAFCVFMASHSLVIRPPIKPWLVRVVGAPAFTWLYSLMSLGLLAWLIAAANDAPVIPLWDWYRWQSHVAVLLMLAACLLLAVALGRPNPFSFGGGNSAGFDPGRPGLIRWSRHPLLVVLALWSTAHIPPNGDLAHVILFGALGLFAVLGGRMVDRRRQREMGEDWKTLTDQVRNAPVFTYRGSALVLATRLLGGAALFTALIWFHPFLIGVNPLPTSP